MTERRPQHIDYMNVELSARQVEELGEFGIHVPGANRQDGGGFAPEPLDYRRLIAEGIPPVSYLEPPYVPMGVSVWATGPTGSAKSMFALSVACRLSFRGVRVVYISQENPRDVELRRIERLGANPDFLELFHYANIDLAQREHADWLRAAAEGAGLVVIDTLTSCWSGDENDNAAIVALDRDVTRPIIASTGASFLTLDHTGHPQPFSYRRGTSAARGASSKGQKADLVLEFRVEGGHRFRIVHAKDRVRGVLEPDRTFEIVDTENDMLEILQVEGAAEEKVRQVAEAMAEYIIAAPHPPSTNELRAAMKGIGGKEMQSLAMALLRTESPLRVIDTWGQVDTPKGARRAKVWIPAPPEMPHG
jgi:hypothetical protein